MPLNLPKNLLIIDDDGLLSDVLRHHFETGKMNVFAARTGAEGLRLCADRRIDVILLDQKLPDCNGVDLCAPILSLHDRAKIIFTTAFPSFENVVQAIKLGAHDYLSKPFDMDELDLAVQRALKTQSLEKIESLQTYRNRKEIEQAILIGSRSGLSEVDRLIRLAAQTAAPVVITGETGTGKNRVARCIHYQSRLKNEAFISINCASLPENLMESELFGHEKGAFTGAVAGRKGIFEMAEGGTLLLDEIAAIPLHLQAKLLGVLDEKRIKRIGGEAIVSVDVRIIAATNADLEMEIRKRRFREDLYYRLSVLRIALPPLRDRKGDIPELCRHFIHLIAPNVEIELAGQEVARLMEYPWPGNVRELKNVIERSIILRTGSGIRPSLLLHDPDTTLVPGPHVSMAAIAARPCLSLRDIEKDHIRAILESLSHNHTRAAGQLGISRSTLMRKIKDYGIVKPS